MKIIKVYFSDYNNFFLEYLSIRKKSAFLPLSTSHEKVKYKLFGIINLKFDNLSIYNETDPLF